MSGACSMQAALVPGRRAGQEEVRMSRAIWPGGFPVERCDVTVGTLMHCAMKSQTGFKIKGVSSFKVSRPMLPQGPRNGK